MDLMPSKAGGRIETLMGQFAVNQTINECYLLREPSVHDGFAESWKASAIFSANQFIIRFLSPDLSQDLLTAEKKLALSSFDLSHPSIASVLEADMIGDRMALVNECDGEIPLSAMLASGVSFTRDDSFKVAIELCRGLEALRRRGIAFGTLAPSSVLVSRNASSIGSVRLLAPGYLPLVGACGKGARPELAELLAYLAPETKGSGAQPVDARSDVFSLGALVFRMVSGTQPFEDRAGEGEKPASLREAGERLRDKGIPAELSDHIVSCLRKNPQDRPSGPAEFARALVACPEEAPRKAKRGEALKARDDESRERIAYFMSLSLDRPQPEPQKGRAAPQARTTPEQARIPARTETLARPDATRMEKEAVSAEADGAEASLEPVEPIVNELPETNPIAQADKRAPKTKKRAQAWRIDIMDARELIQSFIDAATGRTEGFFRFVEVSPSLRAFAARELDLKKLEKHAFVIDARRPASHALALRRSLGEALETALAKRRNKEARTLGASARKALLGLGRAAREAAKSAGSNHSGFKAAAAALAALATRERSLVLVLRLQGTIDAGLRDYLSALAELSDSLPICVFAYYEGPPPVRTARRRVRPTEAAESAVR